MTTGTNHFVSFESARRYYIPYGYNTDDVQNKVANGEITIGPPKTNLKIFTKEGRYFIA